MLCQEALAWKNLDHPHVLPFLGIDSETFAPFFCMVTPWMRHGTILKYLEDYVQIMNLDRCVSFLVLAPLPHRDVWHQIFEIAEGIDYLHSRNVVHGDLRGVSQIPSGKLSNIAQSFYFARPIYLSMKSCIFVWQTLD